MKNAILILTIISLCFSCAHTKTDPKKDVGQWDCVPGSNIYVNKQRHLAIKFPSDDWIVFKNPYEAEKYQGIWANTLKIVCEASTMLAVSLNKGVFALASAPVPPYSCDLLLIKEITERKIKETLDEYGLHYDIISSKKMQFGALIGWFIEVYSKDLENYDRVSFYFAINEMKRVSYFSLTGYRLHASEMLEDFIKIVASYEWNVLIK